ncbi:hypothetical protein DPMN_072020 [Dreissena polymorpha]|uniref:Uncharacterized protein n=1 Tax=Dreissena polymorpha TaxID=45954 RepID=A0A9D4BXG4_DREPO|nr:hypothetical protein DPMN_072020 [Dreissena polymorpha]
MKRPSITTPTVYNPCFITYSGKKLGSRRANAHLTMRIKITYGHSSIKCFSSFSSRTRPNPSITFTVDIHIPVHLPQHLPKNNYDLELLNGLRC